MYKLYEYCETHETASLIDNESNETLNYDGSPEICKAFLESVGFLTAWTQKLRADIEKIDETLKDLGDICPNDIIQMGKDDVDNEIFDTFDDLIILLLDYQIFETLTHEDDDIYNELKDQVFQGEYVDINVPLGEEIIKHVLSPVWINEYEECITNNQEELAQVYRYAAGLLLSRVIKYRS